MIVNHRVSLLLVLGLYAADAKALVWPDVPERIEHGLASQDPNARRMAARELRTLTRSTGIELVMKALVDPDAEVRLAAAEAATSLRVLPATEAVLGWLGDRDARLRLEACEVARALPEPRAVPPLARALSDADVAVRAAAAAALGEQASSDAVAPLLGRLDDASPVVRVEIAQALAKLGDARAVVPLVGKVQDSVSEVRAAVARALGELGDARASQALVLVLRDSVDEVRIEALAALGRLRAADAVDAIAPLVQERKPALHQAALSALGHIGSREAVRVLIGSLGAADDANASQRSPVRDALLSAGPVAVTELTTLLSGSPPPLVAASAAWVIGAAHADSHASDLIAAMRRGVLPAAAALRGLGGAGSADSIAVVLEFVDDSNAAVRTEALSAAGALLDPARPDGRAVEPLAATLADVRLSLGERATVATLLGKTGAARAATALVPLLSVKDVPLRLSAIDALGMLGPGDGSSDAALLKLLRDPDAGVRLHAAVALADAGGIAAREALLGKLDAGEEIDRAALLTALGGIVSRQPSTAATERLARALDVAAGPERDAVIIALARSHPPAAFPALTALARSPDADDRRTLTTALASHVPRDAASESRALPTPSPTEAPSLLLATLRDSDGTVRAEAAWALGEAGSPSQLSALESLFADAEPAVAANAAAAVGRIAERAKDGSLAVRILCPKLEDERALVRVNVLAGLSLSGSRCADGASERRLLATDVDPVRAAAALAIVRSRKSADDVRALERCVNGDRSGAVARRCRDAPRPVSLVTHSVEIYVAVGSSSAPSPHAPFAIEGADGLVHAGVADRRGAVFDPMAPDGELSLQRVGERLRGAAGPTP